MMNTMKKVLAMLVCTVILLGVAGCGTTTKDSGSGNYPTAENPIELSLANFVPETDSLGLIYSNAAEKLEELSGGAIKCKCYYNSTLLGFSDMYSGVSEGIADIGLVGMAVMDSNTDLNQIFSALHKGVPEDGEVITQCYWEAIEQIPEIAEELAKDNLVRVGIQTFAGSDTVICAAGSAESISDLRGMTIQCSQSLPGKLFAKLGASPVSMEISDLYNSLDRGIINGVYDVWTSFAAQKLMEVATDYLCFDDGGLSAGIMSVVMNKATMDKLSPEQQQMVYDAFAYGVSQSLVQFNSDRDAALTNANANAKISVVSGADLEPMYTAIDEVMEEWFTGIENKGYTDVREYYATIESIFAEHMS